MSHFVQEIGEKKTHLVSACGTGCKAERVKWQKIVLTAPIREP